DLPFKRKIGLLLLLDDPFLADYLTDRYGSQKIAPLKKEAGRIRGQFRGNVGRVINDRRSHWIDDIVESATKKQKITPGEFSKAFGRLSRHPVFGIPILLLVVVITFLLVVDVANVIAGWMDHTLWAPVQNKISDIVTIPFWKEFLIGDYGVLSLGLANAFLTILPILTIFFLVLSTLEDIGYIPNVCVLTKRICEKLGLSGNAIMSIALAFACKTMATLTTKGLRSRKEKFIAVYLIAFAIPCAAQMGLNMSILGRMGVWAFMIVLCVLGTVWVSAGLLLNTILKDEEKSPYIQELPAIRLPNPRAVLVKTYYRLWWFIKEAVPVFILAAIALFAIHKLGILDAAKGALAPIVGGFLGLPLRMVDALILCMARHEAAAGLIIKLLKNGELNYVQCIVSVIITTMFVPCFANVMAMIKQLGAKRALAMVFVINCTAVAIAGLLNWALLLFVAV
ncbi:MAG: nucleoside recognition domain-containing protein, partial [Planctomycetota bacterium]